MSLLGLLGDVHAEDDHLARALRFLSDLGVEKFLCTGDIVDGPGSVSRCVELLTTFNVSTVAGNHDRWILADRMRELPEATLSKALTLEARAYLSALPVTYEFAVGSKGAILCHGLLDNDMGRVGPDDYGYALETNDELQTLLAQSKYQLVLNGHTHRRVVKRFKNFTLVNAGTLKAIHDPGFGLLDGETATVHWYDFEADGRIRGPHTEALSF